MTKSSSSSDVSDGTDVTEGAFAPGCGATAGTWLTVHGGREIELSTAATVALRNAFQAFAGTGQNISHFELVLKERTRDDDADLPCTMALSISFVVKPAPGERGLGNFSARGRSITYVCSSTSGDILREYGHR
ncbi:hypothetical protein OOT46_24950 [Aquabacterium sp. A7-Y]|uniref:hypothetical protein n=1 Tax=Aquabacterium sp. A7-Y TaxID=1349605 RepID=UPI00223D77AF|nr:hypothetical protein [Aquabacterium sp. A7-Y]MCW7541071.1 hypothetical protein [Aquabacterium sp. A7-Y]